MSDEDEEPESKSKRERERESETKRDREGERYREKERAKQRTTERDGDLGSAYRSGRVTCVPEVGALAWTNRRATLSLPVSLFFPFGPSPLSLAHSLSPSCVAHPPTRFFLRVYLDTHTRMLAGRQVGMQVYRQAGRQAAG